jgi:hypothetical protein
VTVPTYNVTISQPEDQTTTEGVNATYVLTVTNTGNTADTYALSCENIDSASTAAMDKATMTLAAGASEDVTLNVTNTVAGTFNVTVTAASADATATTDSIITTVEAAISDPISATRDISDQVVDPGATFTVTLTLTANENVQAPALDEDLPAGLTVTEVDNAGATYKATTTEWIWSSAMSSGTSKTVVYNVTVPADATSQDYEITGNASAYEVDPIGIGGESTVTVEIAAAYSVTISQPDNQTTPEGVNATYVLTVTNTGNTTDTYTLSCENIDSATLALDKATMTLAAGASDDVTLNVTNTTAGTFNVTVSATSQTDADANCTTGYIMTTVLETTEVNVTGETNFTAISGDANVTGNFNNTLTGWVNVTDVGDDLTASPDVNKSTRAGLGSSRDVFVSGVYIDASQSNIESELAARNGTIRIELRYTDAEIAALGITNENTLDIYKFNTTTYMWELVRTQTYCNDSGRDTGANYTWVEVTHLCTLALVGTKPAPSRGGGGGGGGTYPPEPTSAPTAAPEPTVASTEAPTEAPTKAPTKAPTAAPTEIKTTELKTEGIPGFGAVLTVFAIAGLLVATYLVMRRRE